MQLYQSNNRESLWKGLAAGILGGLAASYVMEQFQSRFKKLIEGDQSSQRSQQAGQGTQKSKQQHEQTSSGEEDEPATIKAAAAISENVFDHELEPSEKKPAGEIAHYGMGAVSGAIYGAMAEVIPNVTRGAGLPFGTAVWLIADDVVVPALGLSKPPTAYPLSTHAYALASHLIYGLTTDLVRRGVRAAW